MNLWRASAEDWPAVEPLLGLMGGVRSGVAERFGSWVARSDSLVLLGGEGGLVVGYAWVQHFGPHLRSGHVTARLHDLAVLEGWRGRGVGRLLFGGVRGWCAEVGVRWLQWQASSESVGFYERLGLVGDTVSDLVEHPFFEVEFASPPNSRLQPSEPRR